MTRSLNNNKLVLLDRDGVINTDSDDYIKSPEEWHAIPGSIEAIARLYHAGVSVCIITNQSGIGRGYFSEETLQAMHRKMALLLAKHKAKVFDIFYCPHLPDAGCSCRKPKTGMLDELEKTYKLSLKGVPFVGDSSKDIELAAAKNCLPILVKTGKGDKYFNGRFPSDPWSKNALVFNNLAESTDYLLSQFFDT